MLSWLDLSLNLMSRMQMMTIITGDEGNGLAHKLRLELG